MNYEDGELCVRDYLYQGEPRAADSYRDRWRYRFGGVSFTCKAAMNSFGEELLAYDLLIIETPEGKMTLTEYERFWLYHMAKYPQSGTFKTVGYDDSFRILNVDMKTGIVDLTLTVDGIMSRIDKLTLSTELFTQLGTLIESEYFIH